LFLDLFFFFFFLSFIFEPLEFFSSIFLSNRSWFGVTVVDPWPILNSSCDDFFTFPEVSESLTVGEEFNPNFDRLIISSFPGFDGRGSRGPRLFFDRSLLGFCNLSSIFPSASISFLGSFHPPLS